MVTELLTPLAAFAISVFGVGIALWYARHAGLLDVPNHRSSHSIPTPRGGGVALVAAVVTAGVYLVAHTHITPPTVFLILLGAIVALTVVGWADDRGGTPVSLRLLVHATCAVGVALLVNALAPVPGALNVAWLVWWMFWTIASINIVNFMDGLDGMVASQAVVYGAFLYALLGSSLGGRFGLVLAAASLGFLIWNWAPAKIFMGDVGSGPLGLFIVIGGALAVGNAPAAVIFLPLFPLFLDALITVVLRIRRGERITDAHRTHLYQRMAIGGYGHARVTSLYAFAAIIGAAVALLARDQSPVRLFAAIVSYVVIVLLGWIRLHERFAAHAS